MYNKFIEIFHKIISREQYHNSYMYEKYIYNLKIDIKEQSLYFINQLINNNNTPYEIKNIAINELENRPIRLIEQQNYLKNVINKNIIITDIINNISDNDPEWLHEIIDDLNNFSYNIIKPCNNSTFLHKLKWTLSQNYIKSCKLIDKFYLLKELSYYDIREIVYNQIKITNIKINNIKEFYKVNIIEDISNILNNIKNKNDNWINIMLIWQNILNLLIQNFPYNKHIYKTIFQKSINTDIIMKYILKKLDTLNFFDALYYRLDWYDNHIIINSIDKFIINKINNIPYWTRTNLNNINKHLRQKWLFILKDFGDIYQLDNIPNVIKTKKGKLRIKRKIFN